MCFVCLYIHHNATGIEVCGLASIAVCYHKFCMLLIQFWICTAIYNWIITLIPEKCQHIMLIPNIWTHLVYAKYCPYFNPWCRFESTSAVQSCIFCTCINRYIKFVTEPAYFIDHILHQDLSSFDSWVTVSFVGSDQFKSPWWQTRWSCFLKYITLQLKIKCSWMIYITYFQLRERRNVDEIWGNRFTDFMTILGQTYNVSKLCGYVIDPSQF